MDSPLAIINFTNSSNSVVMESGVCDGKMHIFSIVVNPQHSMAETLLMSMEQLRILIILGVFMGKVSTLSTISENF